MADTATDYSTYTNGASTSQASTVPPKKAKQPRRKLAALPSQSPSAFTTTLKGTGSGTAVILDSSSVAALSYFTLEPKEGAPIFQKVNKSTAVVVATRERFSIEGRTGFLVSLS